MVSFDCIDFSTVQSESDELRRIALHKRLLEDLSDEMVHKTIESLEGNELKEWVISYPQHGIMFIFDVLKNKI